MTISWVPLHVHSQYSILDASAPVAVLAKRAADFQIPALALTDHGNMFGAVEFFKACKGVGVKPIIGCEVYVAPGPRHEKRRIAGSKTAFHLVLLAKNEEGYHNLCKLSSAGYLEGFYYNPRVDKEVLKKHSSGLVCLSACLSGRVAVLAATGDLEAMEEEALWYKDLFGEDYYLELQRHHMTEADLDKDGMLQESWVYRKYEEFIAAQDKANLAIVDLANKHDIKYVATNDTHYIDRSDWKAHEILINVQTGEPCEIWEKDSLGNNKRRIPNPRRHIYSSHEMYFKSPEQMANLFADVPDAITNTVEVAEKCYMELDFKTKHYPVYWPENLNREEASEETRSQEVAAFLRRLCSEGIDRRYTEERLAEVKKVYPDKDPLDVVKERLEYELEIIISKSLADYLLIVYDFINWAKRNDVPVGPGRGSGAGSVVLYLIGITDIEPLRFNLFFERFINPERLSYPDIDVDICMERRYRVADYVLKKYGKESVAQIITFGTMKARMAVKDVGRVLSVPLSKVNEIVKLIPDDLNITIDKALEVDTDLQRMYDEDADTKGILDMARVLEGSIRNTGIHAAGAIICGDAITNHVPVCIAKDSELAVSQFSMKPVESVGMLKVDLLGLKTLTSIRYAVQSVKENHAVDIDWGELPLDDSATFALLNQGRTFGVFQLESGGMQDLARRLHLDKFEEIIAMISLYRPGPMDMIPSYVDRKLGREEIEYDHPWLEDILKETYGIMVYQEQVMQIASKLASYSLGEGDILRKAMGKKIMEEMSKQRVKFREGAIANGISEDVATGIFDKMEKFAAYGFNKSHAAAYGYVSYVTAYLKANYPKEWMAALLTSDRDDITKVAKIINECQNMGITILPPDVNEANEYFTATEEGIRFAMTAIKGVGSSVVEAIVEERQKTGPYSGLYEFIRRVDPKRVGKKNVENLVYAGCFDFTGWQREAMIQSIESMFNVADKKRRDEDVGVISLFNLMGSDEAQERFTEAPVVKNALPKSRLLAYEKELLGFYVTGHPLDAYREMLPGLSCVPLKTLAEQSPGAVARVACIIDTVAVRLSAKTQRKFAILKIDDGSDKYELPIWSDLYEENNALIQESRLIYAVLQLEESSPDVRFSCKWVGDLTAINKYVISLCDKAYDKAKLQRDRFNTRNKSKNNNSRKENKVKVEKKEEIPQRSLLEVSIDLDKCRLSHIMALKESFRKNSGDIPVKINFLAKDKRFATLDIDMQWGVKDDDNLIKQLAKMSAVVAVK